MLRDDGSHVLTVTEGLLNATRNSRLVLPSPSERKGNPCMLAKPCAHLKSLKSKAVMVSRTENCWTKSLRITTTRCIRVTTFSMFLSSLTWVLGNKTLE